MSISSNTKLPHKILTLGFLACLTACAGPTFQLSAKVQQTGKNLAVNGSCTLPDKALILVSLLDPTKPADMNHNVIVQEFALVQAGTFKAELKVKPPIAAGKYLLRARFAPNAYDPSKGAVQQAVGAKGEKLTGPQVVSEGDVKMLDSIQEIEYKP